MLVRGIRPALTADTAVVPPELGTSRRAYTTAYQSKQRRTTTMSLVIKLVRHGESLANVGELDPAVVGDHTIGLTQRGKAQARAAGEAVGKDYLTGALAYCSPFRRARETMAGLLEGAGLDAASVRIFEDPRLREVEHGYVDLGPQEDLRRAHGWFYYRFHGGESPADCYDRTSGFLDGLMRQAERKKADRALVVTHSLTIRCFVMRFLHLSVEQFDAMHGPDNCEVVTLAPKEEIEGPLFVSGRWGVAGVRLREGPERRDEADAQSDQPPR